MIQPAMLDTELALWTSFVRCSEHYVEFGSGGSTSHAARLVQKTILSVDSSQEWLSRVWADCKDERPCTTLIHADIGPIRELGYPVDNAHREQWPAYSQSPWTVEGSTHADTYFVDGRFRVACFIEIIRRADPRAVVLIHDFADRPQYHPAHEFGREIARSDTMSAFQRRDDFDPDRAAIRLMDFTYDPR